MLKIDPTPKFIATVTVSTAAIQGSFSATFIARPNSVLKQIEQETLSDGTGLLGFLDRVTESVADIDLPLKLPTRPDGSFESPTQAIEALVDWPGVGAAMQKAYYRGLWEETEKN